MRYTASSIRKALEKAIADKVLHAEKVNTLRCPGFGFVFDNGKKCHGEPSTCPDGLNQKCTRHVDVYWHHMPKAPLLAALTFYYTISKTNNDGFISAGDLNLNRLIDKGYLSKDDFDRAA